MNIPTLLRLALRLFVVSAIGFLAVMPPGLAQAQETGAPAAAEKFSREELAQMLAPIALYPDKLLAQILMASTYPIEVIEADRWVKKNPGLQGDPLDRALLEKEWDPSVKAICHFPEILALMSERISETTNLGNAFLAQEAEVMDMIQELRAKAYAQGNLTSTPEQTVSIENGATIIEPVDPQVMYVPYYDPFYIYGPWWYPAYLPYYWGPPGVSLGPGIWFWPSIYFSYSWGTWGYCDWHHHHVYIHEHKRPPYVRHDHWYTKPGPWHHSPVHRRGVAYRDKFTAGKYGQYTQRPEYYRDDTRGFPGRGEPDRESSRPGAEQAGIGQDRRVDTSSRYERSQQEQQRIERELQKRQELPRQPAERDQQRQPGIDRDRLGPERSGPERQEPTRFERVPQVQERQLRQPTDHPIRARESVQAERPQPLRETVFDLPGSGRNALQSSERGRASRQEWGIAPTDSGHHGGGNEPGRFDGGRNRH